ncbi:MAG: cbb3-type cytochrome c oxidase subunit II [Armatimonadetes bacterium]|nr:cbb3-type cytochrome c oxidase subunit II [Armatimonadota bacterium]MDW8153023.1 cbb3-type cytochrome c oxidase subunit II [Armatimonadota bacterium]
MQRRAASLPLLCLVTALAGFVATVLLPATPPARATRTLTSAQLLGYAVYLREGCAQCHTQQVRTPEARFGVVARSGDLGEVSRAGDYAHLNPTALGTVRIGPDLARVASRIRDPEELLRLLREPRRRSPGSRMPAYAYLSEAELQALVAYLLSLR